MGDLNNVFNFDQVDEDNGETLSSLSLTDDDEESDDTDEVEMDSNFSSDSDSESNQPDENIDDANDNADELDGEDNSQFNDENNVILPRLYENSSLTVDESVLMLLDLYSQNQCTKASLSGTLLMLDKLLPNNNRLPRTIFKLFKYVENLVPSVDIIKHFYCQECFYYLGIVNKIDKCTVCNANKNQFFYFFERDINQIIKCLFEEQNLAVKLKVNNHTNRHIIADITDGSEYRRVNSRINRGPYDLTLILNTDGVALSKSSKTHTWPLMFTIAELPEHLRDIFIIPIGLWCDHKCKPSMNTFLKPFCEKLKKCFNEGVRWTDSVTGNEFVSKIVAPLIIADAPARALVQNIQNFNGKYGCNVCEVKMKLCQRIEGKRSKRIYAFNKNGAKLRDSRRIKKQILKLASLENVPHIKGVKGDTILSKLPLIDLGTCVIPEYMHSALLGVGRQFTNIFVTKQGPWSLKNVSEEINNFLLKIRPPTFVNRIPRRITDFKLFKASEYYYFILFYSLPALTNYLPEKYFNHWILFVKSLFILLQNEITKDDLKTAERLLNSFVKETEILYGDREMSYNIHQLVHFALMVKRWGPLRVTSAFGFENFNGFLAHGTHGTKHLGKEIMNNLKITQGIQILRGRVTANDELGKTEKANEFIGKNLEITFNENESELLRSSTFELDNLKFYSRAKIHKEIYTSENYKTTKTNNFTVQLDLTDGSIIYGSICFFFWNGKFDGYCFASI